jgi:thiol-disulfide isomerase/thioredoxin
LPFSAKITYASPSVTATHFTFSGEIIDRIYLIKRHLTFQFDPARGLLESWTSQDSQGYSFTGQGTGNARLKEVQVRPPEWISQFSTDCAVYLEAMVRYMEARRAALDDPTKCDTLFREVNGRLTAARSQISSPEMAALLDRQIKALPARVENLVQEVHDRQSMLDKPSPDWTLADQAGAKHSLGDYRGKVIVLDFWYRGCGWCMRAMPEMQQLARTFAGKPVAVMGMNTDKDADDVKFVVDAFGLDYPILHLDYRLRCEVSRTRLPDGHPYRPRRRGSRHCGGILAGDARTPQEED